jgi:hypothetical protein
MSNHSANFAASVYGYGNYGLKVVVSKDWQDEVNSLALSKLGTGPQGLERWQKLLHR